MRQLHALTIQQTAAATGEDCRKTRETSGNPPQSPEMQVNLQEKAFACVLHTIMRTETGGAAAQSCKIGAKMQDGSPLHHARPPAAATTCPASGGEVYNSEGQKGNAVRRNSPPCIHVPFHVFYMVISTQNADAASYRQVRGEGGGFETDAKKRNCQKVEVKKLKFRRAHSAIYVRRRNGLCAAVVRRCR